MILTYYYYVQFFVRLALTRDEDTIETENMLTKNIPKNNY